MNKQIKILNKWNNSVIVYGKYESIKDCLEKNNDADLRGAENYSESHLFFQEIIRKQKIDYFTQAQWSMIGQIIIHLLCWGSIKKRYGESIMSIFKKLSKAGWDEFEKKYKEINK